MRHNSIIHNGFDPEFPNRDDYSRAFAETLRRLEKPSCAAVFGGQAHALGALAGSWIRIENLGTARFGSRGVESTAAYTNGNRIVIDSHGGALTSGQVLISSPALLMPPQPFQLDTWGLQGADFGALIFFHELGHRVGIYGKNEDDATNITTNQANTQKIFDACFK